MKNKYFYLSVIILSLTVNLQAETYICAAVYCDPKGQESFFPNTNTPYKSSTKKFQSIYWECATTMFATSKRHNPHAKHLLFTNKTNPPKPYADLLKAMDVQIVTRQLTYVTPDGWHHKFRNTLYTLDCLDHLSQLCAADECAILLDADTVWLNPADDLIRNTLKHGLVYYTPDFDENEDVNGFTRKEYARIIQEITGQSCPIIPQHIGGEMIAGTGEKLKDIVAEFLPLWHIMLTRFAENKLPVFYTEEHYLTFVLYKLGYKNRLGNNFIKRLWTNAKILRKIDGDELNYPIMHLPSEKQRGFTQLFTVLHDHPKTFWDCSLSEFQHLCAKLCSILD